MPTFRHGKNTRVLIDEFDFSAWFNEAATPGTADAAETTAFQQGDKTYIAGLADGTMTLAGMFDGSADAVDEELAARLGQEAQVLLVHGIEGLAIGRRCRFLAGRGTSYEVTSPVSDVVGVSAEFQADGGVRMGHSLHDVVAAESTTGTTNGAAVDEGATGASAFGAEAQLHMIGNTRNGTADVKVQHSSDGTTWVDLITFAQVAAGTKAKEKLAVAGTVNRHTRAVWTLGGTTGGVTFAVAFGRKRS